MNNYANKTKFDITLWGEHSCKLQHHVSEALIVYNILIPFQVKKFISHKCLIN